MYRRSAVFAVVIMTALAVGTAGAAQSTEQQARNILSRVVNYVPNVALDFIDIFEGTVGIGEGNGVDFRATRLLEGGFSNYGITRYGLNGRGDAIYNETIDDGGVGLFGFVFGELERNMYEIGFTVHIVNAGVDASVNVYSGLDFLAGLIFVDVEGDNKTFF